MSDLCRAACGRRRTDGSRAAHEAASLHKNLFIEANPIPVKRALQAMGKMQAASGCRSRRSTSAATAASSASLEAGVLA